MKFLNYLKKYKFYILGFIVITIILLGYMWANKVTYEYHEEVVEEIRKEEEKEEKIETIKVDIKGAVKNPGVYQISIDDRIIDLIKKAGGLTENANTNIINLSKRLSDQDVVIIYTNEEIEKFKEEKSDYSVQAVATSCPDVINKGCIKESENKKEEVVSNKSETKEEINEKININTASKEQLLSIPGIGEAKAKSIILYREENGYFSSIEEIVKVSGIGDNLYETIKDYITV